MEHRPAVVSHFGEILFSHFIIRTIYYDYYLSLLLLLLLLYNNNIIIINY